MLQDDRTAADIIIEARVGVLGADGYAVTYGLPASNMLSTAATLIPETPPYLRSLSCLSVAENQRKPSQRLQPLPTTEKHGSPCGSRVYLRAKPTPRILGF